MMTHQIQNINRELGIIKKNQIEILDMSIILQLKKEEKFWS